MGYRNYRIMERQGTDTRGSVSVDKWYEVVEVYYDDDGKPYDWCPSKVMDDTAEGVSEVLAMMLKATLRPPLREVDFPSEAEAHKNDAR